MADPTTDLDALVARMRELHAPDPEEPGSCFMEYPCEMPALLDALDALRTRLAATITERLDAVTRAELAETACLSARAERDAAQARVRALAEAVERFEGIGHVADCDRDIDENKCDANPLACPGTHRACTCGWSDVEAALDALAAPERGDG